MAVPQFLTRFLRGVLPDDSEDLGLEGLCERVAVDSDEFSVAAYVAGPGDAAVTIVFVHGFTLAAESYFLQVKHVREKWPAVRCVLMDLRGHGETGEVPSEWCNVEGAANDVMAVISQLAPTGHVILVGHSLGGHVVLDVIRRASQRLLSRLQGVILIATSIESLSAQGIPRLLGTKLGTRVFETMEQAPEKVDELRAEAAKLLAPALAATVFKRIGTPYNLVKFHAEMINRTPLATFVGFFDDLAKNSEVHAADRLADLPGFILVGNDDHVTPFSQSERIKELWPSAELRKCDKCGHMMILEAPELVNEAIDSLLGAKEPEHIPSC